MDTDPNRTGPAAEPTPPPPLLLDELSSRCMGNATVAMLLLTKFEAQMRADLLEIEQRLNAGDAAHVARVAHGLKGAAGAVAARPVRDLAAEIESLARQDQLESVTRALPALGAEMDRCLMYLPIAREALERGALEDATRAENAP